MQIQISSGYIDRITARHDIFPPNGDHNGFATLKVIGERKGESHPIDATLFFNQPSDIDNLIREAIKLRDEWTASLNPPSVELAGERVPAAFVTPQPVEF